MVSLFILAAGHVMGFPPVMQSGYVPAVDVDGVRRHVIAVCAVDGGFFSLETTGSTVLARVAAGLSTRQLECLARATRASIPDVRGFPPQVSARSSVAADPCSRTSNAAVPAISPDDPRCRPERGRFAR